MVLEDAIMPKMSVDGWHDMMMCPGVVSRTLVPKGVRCPWWEFTMTVCVGAAMGFGTGTIMTGFTGPIPCGCWIVLMMPVGMGSGDGSTGHLFKSVPTGWGTEWGIICMGKWGLDMQEQRCCQLRLAHGLHMPKQRAEMSRITQTISWLKMMGHHTQLGWPGDACVSPPIVMDIVYIFHILLIPSFLQKPLL
jgi:hypothetical protein